MNEIQLQYQKETGINITEGVDDVRSFDDIIIDENDLYYFHIYLITLLGWKIKLKILTSLKKESTIKLLRYRLATTTEMTEKLKKELSKIKYKRWWQIWEIFLR